MKNLEFLSDKVEDVAITLEEQETLNSYRDKFITAMDDDLNTAEAIGIIFELVREINTKTKENATKGYVEGAKAVLGELTGVLNIAREEETSDVDVALIEEKIAERTAAKKEKNFARADEIRAELLSMGIVIEDTREGVKWHKAD